MKKRTAFMQTIESNIARHGHHVYLVSGEASPRYAYTIGLTETLGSELVFAGGIYYPAEAVKRIISGTADHLKQGSAVDSPARVEDLGSFALKLVRSDWVERLMLGAVDYYRGRGVTAYQLSPDEEHWTIDVPAMDEAWNAPANRAWRWLDEEWPHPIPRKSLATTNLAALRGRTATEAARWEEDEWEIFAGYGPDVQRQDVRVVPLGVLLGVDETLNAVVNLAVGQGLSRDESGGGWQPWAGHGSPN